MKQHRLHANERGQIASFVKQNNHGGIRGYLLMLCRKKLANTIPYPCFFFFSFLSSSCHPFFCDASRSSPLPLVTTFHYAVTPFSAVCTAEKSGVSRPLRQCHAKAALLFFCHPKPPFFFLSPLRRIAANKGSHRHKCIIVMRPLIRRFTNGSAMTFLGEQRAHSFATLRGSGITVP